MSALPSPTTYVEGSSEMGVYGSCFSGPAVDEDIVAYEIRLFKLDFWSGQPYFI
jgi:hypothetical protein